MRISTRDGLGAPRYLPLGECTLGTDPDCSVVLAGESVAPLQASLEICEHFLVIAPLASGHPMELNGMPLHEARKAYAPVVLAIGEISLTFTRDPAAAEEGPMTMSSTSSARRRSDAPSTQMPVPPPVSGASEGAAVETDDNEGASEFPTMAFQMPADLGARVDRDLAVAVSYGLQQELARGGMGRIFVGQDALLDREVAVKVATVDGADCAEAFDREARVLAHLAHPNIVPVYTLGHDSGGRPFYAMKLVRGITLYSVLKKIREGDEQTQREYPREKLLGIFRKVCDAVAFAHSRRYIHRDLKPGNVMIGEFGEVLVMDWGLAMQVAAKGPEVPDASRSADAPDPGVRIIEGTPQYMSPEQAVGRIDELDERSDVYALGAVLYSILTQRPPVEGRDVEEILSKVVRGAKTTVTRVSEALSFTGPQPMESRVPEALRAVTLKAMALRREQRYQRVQDLEADIDAYLSGFATRAEEAGFIRMAWLLVKRNRSVSALLMVMLFGAVFFTVRLAGSERRARKNERIAEEKARLAVESEGKAQQERAVALHEREESRKSAAKAQMTLSEMALKNLNPESMIRALDQIPEDLRDQEWRFLQKITDSSNLTVTAGDNKPWLSVVPLARHPSLLACMQSDGWIRTVNCVTGEQKNLFKIPVAGILPNAAVAPGLNRFAVLRARDSSTAIGNQSLQVRIEIYDALGQLVADSTLFGPCRDPHARLEFSPSGELLAYFSRATVDGFQARCFDANTGLQKWQQDGLTRCDGNWDADNHMVIYSTNPKLGLFTLDGSTGTRLGEPRSIPGFPIDMRTPAHGRTAWVFTNKKPEFIFGLNAGTCRSLNLADGRVSTLAFPREFTNPSCIAHRIAQNQLVALAPVGDTAAWMMLFDAVSSKRSIDIPVLMNGMADSEWRMHAHPVSGELIVAYGAQMKIWSLSRAKNIVLGRIAMKGIHSFTFGPATRQILWLPNGHTGFQLKNLSQHLSTIPEEAVISDKSSSENKISSSRDGRQVLVLKHLKSRRATLLSGSLLGGTLGPSAFVQASEISFDLPSSGSGNVFQVSPSGRRLWTGNLFAEVGSGKEPAEVNRAGLEMPESGKCVEWLGDDRLVEVVPLTTAQTLRPVSITSRALAVWHPGTGSPPRIELAENAAAISASPDGRLLAEAGEDGRVRLRESDSLKETRKFRAGITGLLDVAWHPRLPVLAVLAGDLSIRLWDVEKEVMLEDLGLCKSGAREIFWSPDGVCLGALIREEKAEELPEVEVYAPSAVSDSKIR